MADKHIYIMNKSIGTITSTGLYHPVYGQVKFFHTKLIQPMSSCTMLWALGQSYWNRNCLPNCSHKLGSRALFRISWYAEALRFPFTGINPLGSEVILGPLRCFDMPWYLCLFQLLITYYWPTCICFCIQHKLCYNNMWPRWMYMFAFFRKKILCMVSKFWEKNVAEIRP